MKKSGAESSAKAHVYQLEGLNGNRRFKRGRRAASFRSDSAPKWPGRVALLLSLLACALSLTAAAWLLGADAGFFFAWLGCSVAAGLCVYPLALRLLKRHVELALLFALPLGLLLISCSVWLLAYLRLAPFTNLTIYAAALFWALVSYLYPRNFKRSLLSLIRPGGGAAFFATLAAFSGALLLMGFVRGLMPAARGLEKFMDYGFMMSLWRSEYLPAADPWLAGHSLNYYYYGQYLYSFLSKAAGIAPRYAYNLGLASVFAYMLTLAFGLGYLLMDRARATRGRSVLFRCGGGLLSALFTCFAGNSHDFFISPLAPGKALLEKLAAGSERFGDLTRYYFPDATRYIGYNPPTTDKTIHEFPYYSFLVGDLHAHLVNTSFVLLFLALMLLMLQNAGLLRYARLLRTRALFRPLSAQQGVELTPGPSLSLSRARILGHFFRAWFGSAILPLAGLLLGVFSMGNFWDYPIYFTLMACFLIYLHKRALGPQSHWAALPLGLLQLAALAPPFLWIEDAGLQFSAFLAAAVFALLLFMLKPALWTSSGLVLSLVVWLAQLVSLPFNQQFSPMAKSLAGVSQRTPLFQLLILYGPQALIALFFALSCFWLCFRYRQKRRSHEALSAPLAAPKRQTAHALASDPSASATNPLKTRAFRQKSLLPGRYKKRADRQFSRQLRRMKRPQRRSFVRRLDPTLATLCLFYLCAFGLILAPELLYVRDIYENGFARANTMFKFTYQASILLGLSLPLSLPLLLREYARQRALIARSRADQKAAPASDSALLDKTAGVLLHSGPPAERACLPEDGSLRTLRRLPAWPLGLLGLLCGVLLSAPLIYPFAATGQWIPALKRQNYKGLDAEAWMESERSDSIRTDIVQPTLKDELALIQWINEQIGAQPHILEAAGPSYSDHSLISAYTGLPTVLGWQTHEWLWRTGAKQPDAYAQVVAPREHDTRTLYESTALDERRALLKFYDVEYLVVGNIERSTYPQLDEAGLSKLGEVVFRSGELYLLKVR